MMARRKRLCREFYRRATLDVAHRVHAVLRRALLEDRVRVRLGQGGEGRPDK